MPRRHHVLWVIETNIMPVRTSPPYRQSFNILDRYRSVLRMVYVITLTILTNYSAPISRACEPDSVLFIVPLTVNTLQNRKIKSVAEISMELIVAGSYHGHSFIAGYSA